jgi:hypothetical protein
VTATTAAQMQISNHPPRILDRHMLIVVTPTGEKRRTLQATGIHRSINVPHADEPAWL